MQNAVLTWTANTEPDVAGYKVYRGIDGGAMVLLVTLGKVTTYTDDLTKVVVTHDVEYNLTCYDTSNNESQHGLTVSKLGDNSPPVPPVGLTVVLN